MTLELLQFRDHCYDVAVFRAQSMTKNKTKQVPKPSYAAKIEYIMSCSEES